MANSQIVTGSVVTTSVRAEVDSSIDEQVRALPLAECIQINADIPTAYTTITATSANIAPLAPMIEAGAAVWDVPLIMNLGRYNSAMMRSHTQFLIASEPAASIMPIVEKATLARNRLQTDVRTAIDYGFIPREALVLGAPQAHHQLATDLVVLSTLIVKYWSNIEGKTPLTLESASAAKALADELFAALAKQKEHGDRLADATIHRRAAFTLCMRALAETRRAVATIRYHEGDTDALMPSIYDYEEKTTKKSKDGETDKGEVGKSEPATPASPDAPAKPVSPAPVEPKPEPAPVRPGFPGGNPLGGR